MHRFVLIERLEANPLGYYFLAVGTIILVASVWFGLQHARLIVFGIRTQGEIVDVDERLRFGGGRTKRTYYHPVVEFVADNGHTFQFVYGGASFTRPQLGKAVKVVYQRNRPDQATINSLMGLWAGPVAALVLGAATFYAGFDIVFRDG